MTTPPFRTTPITPGILVSGMGDVKFGMLEETKFADPLCPIASNRVAESCKLYEPGHKVHFIQVKIALRNPLYPVEILSAGEQSFIGIKDGKETTFYTHRPEQIQALLDCYGPGVVGWMHDSWFFECQQVFLCVTADAQEFKPCPPPKPRPTEPYVLLKDRK